MTHSRSDAHLRLVDKGARIVAGEKTNASFSSLDQAYSSLAASRNGGTLSIVVGAGISKPFGIPDWRTLVETLFSSYLSENYAQPTAELLGFFGNNPIVQIRILRRLYQLKTAFLSDLRNAMYANLIDPGPTPALYCLARLVIDTYKRGRPLRVISYNFDDLLENAITAIDATVTILPISSPTQGCSSQDEIRILHPHGYLPRGHQLSPACTVIFSEDDFHRLMSDNAHWANVLQLDAFRNTTCLFVGTSLTDPNVRRLLDHCRKDASQHWMARTLPSSTLICRLLAEEMASLGVRILRLDTYDELPLLFEKLARV